MARELEGSYYKAGSYTPAIDWVGLFKDILWLPTKVVEPYVSPKGVADIIIGDKELYAPNGNGNGGNGKTNRFLPYLLGGMMLVAAAPVVYRAATASSRGKRAARHGEIASSLETSSNRAVSLLGAFAPVVALPATYIAIDELENREIISGKLGDRVQVLISAMASGQLISSLLGLVKAVV